MKNEIIGRDDEIMLEFAEAFEQSHTPLVVRDWMERYPEQARTIAQMASEAQFPVPSGNPTPSLERIRQIGLDALRARKMATTPTSPVLKSLLDAAFTQGFDAAGAAATLEIPFGVFVKLHRRLISPDSVPAAFLSRLADTVGRTVDDVSMYLRQPPTLAVGASYRADETPTVGEQESFAEALRSDPEATTAQQQRWL
jgi:hypothetical protein